MERTLWEILYQAVAAAAYDPGPRRREPEHTDRAVVAVYLWAALHDRPTCWACLPESWPAELRPGRLPSQSTMSRRLRTPAARRLLGAVLRRLGGGGPPDWVRAVDSKPLPVGGCTKDPDARAGRGSGGWFVGYRLHAVWGRRPAPDAWEVLPADRGDPTTARLLVPRCGGGGYLLGDSNYDSNPLHEQAARRGLQVVAPPKRRGRGLGHRRHAPSRVRSLELLGRPFGAALYECRSAIERDFGHLVGFGGGLGPLPAWVRREWRVRLWVQAKLAINAARALRSQKPTAS